MKVPAGAELLLARAEIQDALCRYARGVDRGDWALVRSTYHEDAYDEHGDYKGGIAGLIAWLDQRFAGVDNSMHFLGNCLIEFADVDTALVETYFISRRLRPPAAGDDALAGPRDALAREAWGRYVDRFERRNGGPWLVARRIVVLEATGQTVVLGGARSGTLNWSRRDGHDAVEQARAALHGSKT